MVHSHYGIEYPGDFAFNIFVYARMEKEVKIMKTHVKTHLRRKKHGKSIVRHHNRRVKARRLSIDISKKQPKIVLYPAQGRGLKEFIVQTPIYPGGDDYEISDLRKEAKKQFKENKNFNDLRFIEETPRIVPAFFENAEPVSFELVVLNNKPVRKRMIING